MLNAIYTTPLLARLEKELEKAERLSKSEPEKAHVALERMMFHNLRDYLAMEAAKRECRFSEAQTRCPIIARLIKITAVTTVQTISSRLFPCE